VPPEPPEVAFREVAAPADIVGCFIYIYREIVRSRFSLSDTTTAWRRARAHGGSRRL